jgi:hypothetical protein
MSYSIRRSVTSALVATFTAALLSIAAPAMASANGCPTSSTSHPFSQFGDSAAYSLLPGGSFESGAPGWALTNAGVVSGNESYKVAGGSHSLAIQPNGVAVSPTLCVSTSYPSFRFFARRTSGSWGVLNVILRWSEASGTTHETEVAAIQSGTSWTPTPILKLATTLPLSQSGSTLSTKLVFKPEPYGGAWAIDDVYVDPYSRYRVEIGPRLWGRLSASGARLRGRGAWLLGGGRRAGFGPRSVCEERRDGIDRERIDSVQRSDPRHGLGGRAKNHLQDAETDEDRGEPDGARAEPPGRGNDQERKHHEQDDVAERHVRVEAIFNRLLRDSRLFRLVDRRERPVGGEGHLGDDRDEQNGREPAKEGAHRRQDTQSARSVTEARMSCCHGSAARRTAFGCARSGV